MFTFMFIVENNVHIGKTLGSKTFAQVVLDSVF